MNEDLTELALRKRFPKSRFCYVVLKQEAPGQRIQVHEVYSNMKSLYNGLKVGKTELWWPGNPATIINSYSAFVHRVNSMDRTCTLNTNHPVVYYIHYRQIN